MSRDLTCAHAPCTRFEFSSARDAHSQPPVLNGSTQTSACFPAFIQYDWASHRSLPSDCMKRTPNKRLALHPELSVSRLWFRSIQRVITWSDSKRTGKIRVRKWVTASISGLGFTSIQTRRSQVGNLLSVKAYMIRETYLTIIWVLDHFLQFWGFWLEAGGGKISR